MSSGGLSSERLDRMRHVMASYVERGEVPGLVAAVSRRDQVHVEVLGRTSLGGDAMDRDAIFRVASLTKPVTAVAAMILVEECRLRLDDPVDRFIPELAGRRVLKRPDGDLDDTVPAARPITLRDLLTFRMGLGHMMDPAAGSWPIRRALTERGLLMGPPLPGDLPGTDEWIARVGELPLVHQPGTAWMYDLPADVLAVLIERVTDGRLEAFMRERIFDPLGMKDTGFSVPPGKVARLATSYLADYATGELGVYDPAEGSRWSTPPGFQSGGGGLVSTADDFLAFGRMLLNGGRLGDVRILSRPSVELMTTDHLTPEQKADNGIFFGGHGGWGFGMSVTTGLHDLGGNPGRYGWAGGLGTCWANDPREELVGVLMTQRSMTSPAAPALFLDFWTSAYQAIDD